MRPHSHRPRLLPSCDIAGGGGGHNVAMAGTLPPIHELTAIDQGGAVVVVAYSLVSITILFSVVRLATTRVLKRAFGFDDIAVVVATVRIPSSSSPNSVFCASTRPPRTDTYLFAFTGLCSSAKYSGGTCSRQRPRTTSIFAKCRPAQFIL